jgi:hypothetical protein
MEKRWQAEEKSKCQNDRFGQQSEDIASRTLRGRPCKEYGESRCINAISTSPLGWMAGVKQTEDI